MIYFNVLKNSIISVIFLCFFFISPVASADIVWSSNAMACEPAGAPIIRDNHDSLAGIVRFKAGHRGDVILICAISSMLTKYSLRSLRLTYRDGDGKEGPSVVSAAIRKVRISDGHVVTLTNGSVSSNDSNAINSGPNGWATHQSGTVGHVLDERLDLSKYYYYVQINMKRTNSGVPLAVMGVYLVN